MKKRLSLGSVLVLMNLAALLLPLSGLWFLRLYESALIRQTEQELIAQGAMTAAMYRQGWLQAGGNPMKIGLPVDPRWTSEPGYDQDWLPRRAHLDLASDPVLPSPQDPVPSLQPADPISKKAGTLLNGILKEAQKTTLSAIRILDLRGNVVATTSDNRDTNLLGQEEVARALQGEPVSVMRKRANGAIYSWLGTFDRAAGLRVFVALPVLADEKVVGAVLVSRTPRTLAETLQGKIWHLAGLSLFLLAAVSLLAAFGNFAIGRPLVALTGSAKRISENPSQTIDPVASPLVREIGELSQALVGMSETLKQRADYIQDFAAHVSHEFKTPLTSIQGAVELLKFHLDEMTSDERNRFLSNLESDARRLQRLVERLLDLARADTLPRNGQENCNVADVLERMAGWGREHGLDVTFSTPKDVSSAWLAIDGDILESVLISLADNVLQHGGNKLWLSLEAKGDAGIIVVEDNGTGVSPANAGKLFTPFFTTKRDKGNTGLGLAVAKSLLAAHRGDITLVPPSHGQGAAFRIDLPIAAE